ncbi:MAG: NAD-dependent epimerase [Alphaproteobacteria bacterium]
MNIIVTGAAGFIGMHVCKNLLDSGHSITGLDNLNAYYDQTLKQKRLECLTQFKDFTFYKQDIADKEAIMEIFTAVRADCVIHLAAQAGVRYSLIDPDAYANSNLTGFLNILEACRQQEISHLIYASSSSIYGSNDDKPFKETHNTDHPVSLYGATKKANEVMAHSYSHLFQLPTTGLRFFTVYGPWGRPDMALFLFTKAILENKPIDIYNRGKMIRDFTYIDDVVQAINRLVDTPATANADYNTYQPDASTSNSPWRIFNIGNGSPTSLTDYISALEKALGRTAEKNFIPAQPGDVLATAADTTKLENWTGFKPSTSVEQGVENFVKWYVSYYNN